MIQIISDLYHMRVNSTTKIYGSFSQKAGDVGCLLFNTSFNYYDINAIYKSFSVSNIKNAIEAAKCLHFSGFAVSMPFKTEIIPYLDDYDETVKKTNSCNTVIVTENKLYGYNTDYYAIHDFLAEYSGEPRFPGFIYILGNGSYAGTLKVCCDEKGIEYKVITRANWDDIVNIKNSFIFNCTPVEDIVADVTNTVVHSVNTTYTGKKLATRQAAYQFKLYTGLEFPLKG
jgi:shikimate dehydrogenase